MYNKQLLKLLEPYRDKTLSFGCEVRHNDGEVLRTVRWNTSNDSLDTVPLDVSSPFDNYNLYPTEYTVLGHPPTLNTVLMALDLPGDTRYESVVLKGNTLTISAPNGKATHFIDEENGTPGTNYEWTEVTLDLNLSPSQYSEEVSEKLVKLLTK